MNANTKFDEPRIRDSRAVGSHPHNVYAQLDNARFSRFHIKAVLVSGVGFFTDAYDLFAINLITPMIGYAYYGDNNNTIPSNLDSAIKGMSTAGTLVGQLLFGYLADRLGRKRMYGVELVIMIVATVAGSFSADLVHGFDVVTILCIWRFILGIGIGGDYPLSAVITSEFATVKHRGAMIAAVFAMQGFGILASSIVGIIVVACFKSSLERDPTTADYCWRIMMGVGAIPACCALYSRLTIPETPRFTRDVTGDASRAVRDTQKVAEEMTMISPSVTRRNSIELESPHPSVAHSAHTSGEVTMKHTKPTLREFWAHFRQWKHGKVLIGTSMAWFCLDVAFYGTNMNQSIVLGAIGYATKGENAYHTLMKLSVGSLIIACLGTVPGYWFSVAFIDRWGRKPIQFMGFTICTIFFVILAAAYNQILGVSTALFIVFFTIIQFFLNFGPNATTFVLPGELFPTRFRSTAHGISAASGKAGAILATYAFGPLKDVGGKNHFIPEILGIFAVFMFLGLLFTFLVPETKGKTLEELSGEDERVN